MSHVGMASELQRRIVRRFAATQPQAQDVAKALLDGLEKAGWAVKADLAIPHASTPDFGGTRLWFKKQAIYINDRNTDPKELKNAHSLSSDLREYRSLEDLVADVARKRRAEEKGAPPVLVGASPSAKDLAPVEPEVIATAQLTNIIAKTLQNAKRLNQ